jgi:hypothetical protein
VAAHTLTGCHAAQRRERRIIQVELRTAVISRQEDERGLSIICEIRRQPRLAILAFCPTGVKSLLWKFFFDDLYGLTSTIPRAPLTVFWRGTIKTTACPNSRLCKTNRTSCADNTKECHLGQTRVDFILLGTTWCSEGCLEKIMLTPHASAEDRNPQRVGTLVVKSARLSLWLATLKFIKTITNVMSARIARRCSLGFSQQFCNKLGYHGLHLMGVLRCWTASASTKG